jgi:hypothetical protein
VHLTDRCLRSSSDLIAGERHKFVGAEDQLATGFCGVADEVVGKNRSPCRPVLGIEVATVAGFELLDGLDGQQRGRVVISDHFVGGLGHCSSITVGRRFVNTRRA